MAKHIELGNLKIGQGYKPVFIAELGINHNGDLRQALELVGAAVGAGADIIKFQHHIPALEMSTGHEWQQLMKDCALQLEELEILKEVVESCGREFLCTPFCNAAAQELNEIGVKGFKTGSGEANNIPFLESVARHRKPMLISTGMSSRNELLASIDAVRLINPDVVLLNCTSTYPATTQEARLKRIGWLYSVFGRPVGQSDHTPTISTALGAVALGAVCIEKHVTLDRNAKGPDHAASIIPSELRQLVDMVTEIWEGLEYGVEAKFGILPGEVPVRAIANHSVAANRPIKKGAIILSPSLTTMRPGNEIPAAKLREVVGKVTTRDIDAGELLRYTDIA